MGSSVSVLVLEQGSATANPDGLTVTVDELHKVAINNEQLVYAAGEVVSLDEAKANKLYAEAKKAKKSAKEQDGDDGGEA